MPRLLFLSFVFLIGIGSAPAEARELSSEKLSHRIQALQGQITSIQNNTLRASLYSVEELQEELNTLINLSRLEDKLTVVRVNREHPLVELHLADIERTTIETPVKSALWHNRNSRSYDRQPKMALKKPAPKLNNSTGWMPVSDKPVQVALVDPLSVAGTRPRYAESRGAVAEQTVQEKKNAMKSRWEVIARALHMRPFERMTYLSSLTPGGKSDALGVGFSSGIEGRFAYNLPNSNWSLSATGRYYSMYTKGHGSVTEKKNFNVGFRGRSAGVLEAIVGSTQAVEAGTDIAILDIDATFKTECGLNLSGGIRFASAKRSLEVHTSKTSTSNTEFASDNYSQYWGIALI